ncbi:hypothetical protein Pint_08205 [Pistacia integerrima]|uniref:Uncharacterized protein n=1 Tax=Pistacia integerrima TaxID=434235 RepID=A0ACC0XV95_9ROSI|nr:hypothetical protein Pint_08205 [Pistacia integerrima]
MLQSLSLNSLINVVWLKHLRISLHQI